ncbi:MAG: DnaT-like ssDNA-binding domain-containing protein [Rhodanobacteraceae bacterium]
MDIVDIPQSPQPSTESTPSASPSTSKEQKKEHPAQPAAARGKRGSRIPDDWQPSAELREWAKREHPSVDLKLETAKFIDFWQAKAGRDAAKLDWTATFRNWIRNARTATGFVAPPATVGGHARQTKEQALKPAESRFESQMRYLSGELKAGRITQEKFDAETIFWRNKLKGQK